MEESFNAPQTSIGRTSPVAQNQPPMHRPVQHSPSHNPNYLSIAIVGIIILMIGSIIWVSGGFLDPGSDASGILTTYSTSTDYKNNRRILTTVGNLVEYIGVFILSIGLLIGALGNNNLSANTRMGMLIAMGLIIGFKIGGFFNYFAYVT